MHNVPNFGHSDNLQSVIINIQCICLLQNKLIQFFIILLPTVDIVCKLAELFHIRILSVHNLLLQIKLHVGSALYCNELPFTPIC